MENFNKHILIIFLMFFIMSLNSCVSKNNINENIAESSLFSTESSKNEETKSESVLISLESNEVSETLESDYTESDSKEFENYINTLLPYLPTENEDMNLEEAYKDLIISSMAHYIIKNEEIFKEYIINEHLGKYISLSDISVISDTLFGYGFDIKTSEYVNQSVSVVGSYITDGYTYDFYLGWMPGNTNCDYEYSLTMVSKDKVIANDKYGIIIPPNGTFELEREEKLPEGIVNKISSGSINNIEDWELLGLGKDDYRYKYIIALLNFDFAALEKITNVQKGTYDSLKDLEIDYYAVSAYFKNYTKEIQINARLVCKNLEQGENNIELSLNLNHLKKRTSIFESSHEYGGIYYGYYGINPLPESILTAYWIAKQGYDLRNNTGLTENPAEADEEKIFDLLQ